MGSVDETSWALRIIVKLNTPPSPGLKRGQGLSATQRREGGEGEALRPGDEGPEKRGRLISSKVK